MDQSLSQLAPPAAQAGSEGPQGVVPKPTIKHEVVGRSAFSRTEANTDGSFTATYSAGRPLYWLDGQTGQWRDFNDSLTASATSGYTYESSSNGYRVLFGDVSSVAGGGPLIRVIKGDSSVSAVAVGASPQSITASGSAVTYTDLYPGVDVRYIVDHERIKEVVVLKSAPAAASISPITFNISVSGMSPTKGADGSLRFATAAGKSVFRMPKPFLIDGNAKGDPEAGYTGAVGVGLTTLGSGIFRIQLTPDASWLSDPARVWPVVLDPTIEDVSYVPDGATGQDAPIYEADPSTNYGAHPYLDVGKRSDGKRRDTLIQFPDLDSIPTDSAIVSATLSLYSSSGTDALPMEVHANTSAWDEATATWASAPSMGGSVYARASSVLGGWTSFNLNGLARYWLRGTLRNNGVRILSPDALAGQSAQFASSNSTTDGHPQLIVSYVPATRLGANGMWQYTSQAYGGGTSSSVNTSTGNVVISHPDSSIPARGFNVDITHVYNSEDPYGQTDYYDRPGAFYGEGWTISQNLRLWELGGGGAVVFKDGSGGSDRVFIRNSDNLTTRVRSYMGPLYYDYALTKDISATPADPDGVYALKPLSSGVTFYFDGGGKLKRAEDRNGNYLSYAYDSSGRLTAITDVAGRQTVLEYTGPGSPGRLSKITDMAGRISTFGYDGAGNLTTISHGVGTPDQVATTFGYGVGNMMTSVTNPRGYRSYIRPRAEEGWDTAGSTDNWVATGSAVSVAQATDHVFRGTGALRIDLGAYSPCALPCSNPPRGASRTFPTPVSLNSTEQELMAWVYAPTGSSISANLTLTDARGYSVSGPSSALSGGQWTAVRMPYANINPSYKIKVAAVQITPMLYTGSVWVDQLQVRGVADSLTDAKATPNTVRRIDYNWDNAETTVGRPNTAGVYQDTTYTYDKFGIVTQTIEPGGRRTTSVYDSDLRLQSVTSEGTTTDPEYYAGSNKVKTITSTGTGTSTRGVDTSTGDTEYEIDERNENRRNHKDANGQPDQSFVAIVYVHDANGNITSVEVNRYAPGTNLDQAPFPTFQEQLKKTGYTYLAGSLVASMTDPNGNVTRYTYNTSGYLTKIDAPPGMAETARRVTTVVPNADGSIGSGVDPKGQKTTYEYNGLGQLLKVSYGMQDGAADYSTSYAYDANGNTLSMTDREGRTTYAYDENDALTSESRAQNGVTKTASYTYYPNGRMQRMTPMGGGTTIYTFNAEGELESLTDPKDGGQAIHFSHDNTAHTATTTYPSGVSRTVTYDVAGRVKTITLRNSAGMVLQSFAYDYGLVTRTNADGTVTTEPGPDYRDGYVLSMAEQDGSKVEYGYDDLGRLASAVRTGSNVYTQSYGYDANDNRTRVTVNGVTITATFDAANQLTSQGNTSYTYDQNGNLVGYGGNTLNYDVSNKWTSGTVNGASVSFGYDGQGRRVSRTVGTERTDFWYDLTGLTLETGATGATYLRGPAGNLLSRSETGSLVNYSTDNLGSVTALTTDNGSVASSYTYGPWGEEVASTGLAVHNPHRYTSTYLDSATGMYQMGARYYQPGTAAFTQADPRGGSAFEGQRYTYTVGANPVNATDPSGMATCRWAWGSASGGQFVGGYELTIEFKYCWNGSSAWLGRYPSGALAWWASGDTWGYAPWWNWDAGFNNGKGAAIIYNQPNSGPGLPYNSARRTVAWRGHFWFRSPWWDYDAFPTFWVTWTSTGRILWW
jgi:RHS repeat-associated protein